MTAAQIQGLVKTLGMYSSIDCRQIKGMEQTRVVYTGCMLLTQWKKKVIFLLHAFQHHHHLPNLLDKFGTWLKVPPLALNLNYGKHNMKVQVVKGKKYCRVFSVPYSFLLCHQAVSVPWDSQSNSSSWSRVSQSAFPRTPEADPLWPVQILVCTSALILQIHGNLALLLRESKENTSQPVSLLLLRLCWFSLN